MGGVVREKCALIMSILPVLCNSDKRKKKGWENMFCANSKNVLSKALITVQKTYISKAHKTH